MDGSRGATGSVDVGVSHLNMNINVTAGGLGTVGIQGNNDATGDTASASSSPPVGFGTSNGGLPSGRSRSPGFDVDPPGTKADGVSAIGTDGGTSNAAAFLAGAAVVTGASGTSSGASGSASVRGWGAAPGGDDGRKDVDHAFTGAMLQRSSSAPPMSDHVDGWARSVPGRVPGGGLDGIPSGPAAVDSDYYYYYYAPHSVNPRLAGSLRDGLGGSRILAAPIAQTRAHLLDNSTLRDGAVGDPTAVGDGVLSGRTSPLSGGEADAVASAGGGVAGAPGSGASGSSSSSKHFRKLNGSAGVPGGSGAGSGDEGHVGGATGGASAALSRVKSASGVAVGNGPARSASPPGFPDLPRSASTGPGVGAGGAGGAGDRAFDFHAAGGVGGAGGAGGSGGGAGVRYGVGSSPESSAQQMHGGQQQQQQQQHMVGQHRQSTSDGFGVGARDSGAVGAGGDFVAAMSALSLGASGSSKAIGYSTQQTQQSQQQQQQTQQGRGTGVSGGNRMDPYSNHVLESSRAGGALHSMMPPSPYSGAQMSPYGGPQSVPSGALIGTMPLTPEMHPGTMMNYQLDPRHLAQLPPPDPRIDTRMQNDRGGLGAGGGGLGGADPGSHMRGGGDPRMVGGGSGDGAYFSGQGLGGQQGYGLDPRSYTRVLQSPRAATYGDPMALFQQDQSPASPMLGSRRLPPDVIGGGGGGGTRTAGYGYHSGNGGAGSAGLDPRMGGATAGTSTGAGRMRGRSSGSGHLDDSMMSPRATGMSDPYYGGQGRAAYHPNTDGRLGGGGGGGSGVQLRYGGVGGGRGGMGMGMGHDDIGDIRGAGMDLRDIRSGDMLRAGVDIRAVDGRGDLRGAGMDIGPGVELGYRDGGPGPAGAGGGGGGGGRRPGAPGSGMGGLGGVTAGERMIRGPGGHHRDLDGGMHGGDMRMDPRTASERIRGSMGPGQGDLVGIRDQRGMSMRGSADHRDARRPDMRHGRDGSMVAAANDRVGSRGGGYMDNRGLRDREGRLGGGRPGGMGGMGVGPGGSGGRGSLLDEFRSSIGKNRKWELQDLHGHTVQFCRDQHGSRFIQQKLEVSSEADKEAFFDEILPHTQSLMTDVFGNYVVQKLFDNGSAAQRESLASFLVGHAVQLSLQMYGCRVVQKALEYASIDTLIALVSEFGGQVMKCVQDQNGNHVVQKCIEVVSTTAKTEGQYLHSHIQFIIDGFVGQVEKLSMHAYGCRVIQRILEHCVDEQKQVILEEIKDSFSVLIQDQYGNYVIQHVLKHGRPTDRGRLMREVKENLLVYSQHKFASNVVEKCLQYGTKEERGVLIQHLLYGHSEGTSLLQVMVCDPYANYVVQKIIDVADQEQRQTIIMEIRTHASQLKRYTFGKHIISRLEKLSGKKM